LKRQRPNDKEVEGGDHCARTHPALGFALALPAIELVEIAETVGSGILKPS